MAHLVIGLGTGRCGTVTLTQILGHQQGVRASHESWSPVPWEGEQDHWAGRISEKVREVWLKSWNSSYGAVPCFGGLASGGREPEEMFLLNNGEISAAGGLAISFSGGVKIGGIVSQGCRPIGNPYTITEVDDNVLLGIASRGDYEVLEKTFDNLAEEEKERAHQEAATGVLLDALVHRQPR